MLSLACFRDFLSPSFVRIICLLFFYIPDQTRPTFFSSLRISLVFWSQSLTSCLSKFLTMFYKINNFICHSETRKLLRTLTRTWEAHTVSPTLSWEEDIENVPVKEDLVRLGICTSMVNKKQNINIPQLHAQATTVN